MLAVFEKAIGKPPVELNLPSPGSEKLKSRPEITEIFQSLWPESTLYNLSNGTFMALSQADESPLHPRRYYGLSRQATEAMVLIEAYKALRDRAPYPPDQVIKDLEGKFAFILRDSKSHTLFAARDREGGIDLKLVIAGDGSLICSNDPNIMKEACGNSFAPFPPGGIFMHGSGLTSFVHTLQKVRGIVREDDDGLMPLSLRLNNDVSAGHQMDSSVIKFGDCVYIWTYG